MLGGRVGEKVDQGGVVQGVSQNQKIISLSLTDRQLFRFLARWCRRWGRRCSRQCCSSSEWMSTTESIETLCDFDVI